MCCEENVFLSVGHTHTYTHTHTQWISRLSSRVKCQACGSGQVWFHSKLLVRGLSFVWADGEGGWVKTWLSDEYWVNEPAVFQLYYPHISSVRARSYSDTVSSKQFSVQKQMCVWKGSRKNIIRIYFFSKLKDECIVITRVAVKREKILLLFFSWLKCNSDSFFKNSERLVSQMNNTQLWQLSSCILQFLLYDRQVLTGLWWPSVETRKWNKTKNKCQSLSCQLKRKHLLVTSIAKARPPIWPASSDHPSHRRSEGMTVN